MHVDCAFVPPNQGSRSVHNTRIERLWYDVTHGFGQKWKNFFTDLEAHEHLNPSQPHHIWLLHFLFLDALNEDCQEWVETWNSHVMQIRGERNRSPRDIFLFSLLQDGPRGLAFSSQPPDEDIADPATYGIDWEVADDPTLMAHLLEHNPQEWEDENPFQAGRAPPSLSEVRCEEPGCPFTDAEVDYLRRELVIHVDCSSRSMVVRRLVWRKAYEICSHIIEQCML